MGDPAIPDTVVVSRQFWVAAANAIRKLAGHVTSDEESLSNEQAWQYVLRVARGEEVLKPPLVDPRERGCP
jgi:hypothetical protein